MALTLFDANYITPSFIVIDESKKVCVVPGNNGFGTCLTDKTKSSGKWQFEVTLDTEKTENSGVYAGIASRSIDLAISGTGVLGASSDSIAAFRGGVIAHLDGSQLTGLVTFTDLWEKDKPTLGIVWDVDNKTLEFYVQGVLQGSYTYTQTVDFYPAVSTVTREWYIEIETAHFKFPVAGALPYDDGEDYVTVISPTNGATLESPFDIDVAASGPFPSLEYSTASATPYTPFLTAAFDGSVRTSSIDPPEGDYDLYVRGTGDDDTLRIIRGLSVTAAAQPSPLDDLPETGFRFFCELGNSDFSITYKVPATDITITKRALDLSRIEISVPDMLRDFDSIEALGETKLIRIQINPFGAFVFDLVIGEIVDIVYPATAAGDGTIAAEYQEVFDYRERAIDKADSIQKDSIGITRWTGKAVFDARPGDLMTYSNESPFIAGDVILSMTIGDIQMQVSVYVPPSDATGLTPLDLPASHLPYLRSAAGDNP